MNTLPHHQHGAASLLITLALLTVITFVSLYTSRTVMMEQKISANEYRSRVAFESAEAGAEAAIAYISNDWDRNDDGNPDPVFDTDGDDVGDSQSANITLASGTVTGSVRVTVTDISDNDLVAMQIQSVGTSPDGSAERTITQVMAVVSPLPNAPDNPLLTRGTIVINGSATVHNEEGASTIWSGSDVDLGSNNSTKTKIADPNDANYPDCLGGSVKCGVISSSDRYTAGLDIIENDDSLANLTGDEFFENFFGLPPNEYRNSRVTLEVAAANVASAHDADPPGLQLATNEIVWVDGDVSMNGGTVGCTTAVTGNNVCPANNIEPSIVIIDGDASFSGSPHFYGLLYITGEVTVSGDLYVRGAQVVQGNNATTTGSLDIWYDSSVLRNIAQNGRLGGGGGSWRDFE
jgi:Tfp pilus assembly protein PilX